MKNNHHTDKKKMLCTLLYFFKIISIKKKKKKKQQSQSYNSLPKIFSKFITMLLCFGTKSYHCFVRIHQKSL